MEPMERRLALHTWTLESTPLAETLRIAKETGWGAIELRRKDFEQAAAVGQSAEQVVDLVRASGLPVASVGVASGWVFAEGDEQRRLFEAFADSCRLAVALGCNLVMSPVGPGRGPLSQAAASVRAAGDIAGAHDLRLAFEFNFQHEQINTLERAREVLAAADHPRCGLLLDAYHLQRTGRPGRGFQDVPAEEILFIQYSDVPASDPPPGPALDRVVPGQGVAQLREFFALLADKGYGGYLSYEAPNPATWARDPREVAREALDATRALLP
jgi:sugar phosphate isomerase/epimerase